MLSIKALGHSTGSENYYTSLAKENYYISGGEPLGKWIGKGAEKLNLPDIVEAKTFKNLLRGFDRTGQQKLVQNAGEENRRPGYDLTFSAPKSVSVLWSQANRPTQDMIQKAHFKAVQVAIDDRERRPSIAEIAAWDLSRAA